MDVDLQDKAASEQAVKSCIDWDLAPGGERECTDEEPCRYHDVRPQFWSAAIYFEDRYYGGPEEGGWWYNAGEPVTREVDLAIRTRFFKTAEEAYQWAGKHLAPVCEKKNVGRRPISSMASQGQYTWRVMRGYPTSYPEHTPHYE